LRPARRGAFFCGMLEGVYYFHHAAEPYFNMAFDECLLARVVQHPETVVLRLYTWGKGTITIGFNQTPEKAVDLTRIGRTPLIRRITGGRAVYHDGGELTYSIALNLANESFADWAGKVGAAYLQIAKGLQAFLNDLGLDTHIVRGSPAGGVQPVSGRIKPCFESVARYELRAERAKIVASAQRQVGDGLLQHGSIKLHGVALHPALAGTGQQGHPVGQPLGRKRLECYASKMAGVLGATLGVVFTARSQSCDYPEALAQRVDLVRSKPLAKRHPIEQSGFVNSL